MTSTPQSRPRRRNVGILTQSGFQKLQSAQAQSTIWDHDLKTCTLEKLSERTGLSTHTLSKVHARKAGVDLRTLVRYFSAFDLTLETSDYTVPTQTNTNSPLNQVVSSSENHQLAAIALPAIAIASDPIVSWGTAPDVSRFYGRTTELVTLKEWILDQRCRLVTLSGMGGIGKTWLAAKVSEQIQTDFKVVIWRSLRPMGRSHRPLSFETLLDELLTHIAPQSDLGATAAPDLKILQLMDGLQKTPCLIVLDNVESILPQSIRGESAKVWSESSHNSHNGWVSLLNQGDYHPYHQLFRLVAQGRHQSCLMLTSREEPNPIQQLSGMTRQVRLLPLNGLPTSVIRQIFETKGEFQGTPTEWEHLVHYYDGNPLILDIVATLIQRLFNGSIPEFLTHNALLFDDICELLEQQIRPLSDLEKAVMNVLARQDLPCSLSTLRSRLPSSISSTQILNTLKSLGARSLLQLPSPGSAARALSSHYIKDYVREYMP